MLQKHNFIGRVTPFSWLTNVDQLTTTIYHLNLIRVWWWCSSCSATYLHQSKSWWFLPHGRMCWKSSTVNLLKSVHPEAFRKEYGWLNLHVLVCFNLFAEKKMEKSVQNYAQKIRKYAQKSANMRKNPQIGICPFSGFLCFRSLCPNSMGCGLYRQ